MPNRKKKLRYKASWLRAKKMTDQGIKLFESKNELGLEAKLLYI